MHADSRSLSWEALLPQVRGPLPLGGELRRTDPGGTCPAPVAIVGLYPAVTRRAVHRCADGTRISVPTAVETRSFEGSQSALEIAERYLEPLGLSSHAAFTIDLYPYYLANTAVTGADGRSMWINVQRYERDTNTPTAVEGRPPTDALVRRCRDLPGNAERLAYYFGACRPTLVITLGNEVAAFVRGYAVSSRAQEHLYGPPIVSDAFGLSTTVVHSAHPGLFIRRPRASTNPWLDRHTKWCAAEGRSLVAEALANWPAP